jgi:hypothetical protein
MTMPRPLHSKHCMTAWREQVPPPATGAGTRALKGRTELHSRRHDQAGEGGCIHVGYRIRAAVTRPGQGLHSRRLLGQWPRTRWPPELE